MRVWLAAMIVIGLAAPSAAADRDAAAWLAKARSIILEHHLLSRTDLRCTALVYGVESTPGMAGISAIEKHGGHCGGDPETSPRLFTLDIDKATGRASWDRNESGVMTPIP